MSCQETEAAAAAIGVPVLVDVKETGQGPRLVFSGGGGYVQVSPEGDLTIHVSGLFGPQLAVISFEIAGDDDDFEFLGIQLGTTDQGWGGRPTTLDTHGKRYRSGDEELPFFVAPGETPRAFELAELVREAAPIYDYRLHVRRGNETITHDPKIYNEGGTVPEG